MLFRSRRHRTLALLAGAGLLSAGWGLGGAVAAAQEVSAQATAALVDRDGEPVGDVVLRKMPRGTLLEVRLDGLPPGVCGFHVHETGLCEAPFDSAGGHFNPEGVEHGFAAEGGQHAGDMPNIHMPESGALELEIFNGFLVLDDRLLDDDGAAIVIHDGADDYASQPAGAAGERIACGVIEPS